MEIAAVQSFWIGSTPKYERILSIGVVKVSWKVIENFLHSIFSFAVDPAQSDLPVAILDLCYNIFMQISLLLLAVY